MGLWRAALGLAALWAGLGLAGCAPSAEEIQEEFEEYVDGVNACSVATECAVVMPGCPLGCGVAVRVDQVAAVERKADELIGDYVSGGQVCIYTCPAPGAVECVGGRCAFEGQPEE